jgi:hypothetical protein
VSAQIVRRATGSGAMALCAALVAGGMSSAWLNATETEVYAASLALGILMIWAGDRAGGGDRHWLLLTAYLMALASALVAAPAAIALAAQTPRGFDWRRVLMLGGVLIIAMAAGRMSAVLAASGVALLIAAFWPYRRPLVAMHPVILLFITALALSALLFLIIRARFDPAINQGDPSTCSTRFLRCGRAWRPSGFSSPIWGSTQTGRWRFRPDRPSYRRSRERSARCSSYTSDISAQSPTGRPTAAAGSCLPRSSSAAPSACSYT